MRDAVRHLLCLCLVLWTRTGFTQIVTTAIIGEEASEEETGEGGGPQRERFQVVSFSSWKLFYAGNVTVLPDQPVTLFTIPVSKDGDGRLPARYNITMTIPSPPEGCDPNVTLWYSPAVYYEELCMERDFNGRCTFPSKEGFTSSEELIQNYNRFKRVLFDYEWENTESWRLRAQTIEDLRRRRIIQKTLKGIFCHDDRDYWLAFSTSCYNATYIDIQVGIKDMRSVDDWTCRGMDYFLMAQTGSDAFFTSRLFWAIIVPIGYFIFLFLLIFGCGYLFNCGAKGRVSVLLKLDFNFELGDSDDSDREGPSTPRRKKR